MPTNDAGRETAWGRFNRIIREFEEAMDMTEIDLLAVRFANLEERLALVEAQLKEKTNVQA